jgi:hypothetical protein
MSTLHHRLSDAGLTTFTLQPIRIRTGSLDTNGRLALADGELVAVFVCLDDPVHDADQGRWFMEASFGTCLGRTIPPLFDTLGEVEAWCRARLAD